uniref:Uncharacterized protein n=1 Tax=Lygus hesperus TaxID=30085 RepID=A0A146L7S3_LYGHE
MKPRIRDNKYITRSLIERDDRDDIEDAEFAKKMASSRRNRVHRTAEQKALRKQQREYLKKHGLDADLSPSSSDDERLESLLENEVGLPSCKPTVDAIQENQLNNQSPAPPTTQKQIVKPKQKFVSAS